MLGALDLCPPVEQDTKWSVKEDVKHQLNFILLRRPPSPCVLVP